MATTPIAIFDDLGDARIVLPGTSPAEVANGLISILRDEAAQKAVVDRQRAWIREREWSRMAERLSGMLKALLLDARYSAGHVHPDSEWGAFGLGSRPYSAAAGHWRDEADAPPSAGRTALAKASLPR